jgi:hypothetical protein
LPTKDTKRIIVRPGMKADIDLNHSEEKIEITEERQLKGI